MALNLNHWLRKTPQPAFVQADDKMIAVPKNARAWKDLTKTVQALEPSKLIALDVDKNVIRSVTLENEEEGKDANLSPEMSDLQLFAKLLAEAYDKAGSKMQPIIDSAMAFVERGGQRLAKAEADNERLRQHVHKLNLQITQLSNQPEPGGEDSIVGALVAGAMQAAGGSNPLAVIAGKGGTKK